MAPPGTYRAFPKDTTFSYLAEGAANIVYRFNIRLPTPTTPPPTEIEEYQEGEPEPTLVMEKWHEEFDSKSYEWVTSVTFTAGFIQTPYVHLVFPLEMCTQCYSQSLMQNDRQASACAQESPYHDSR